jgi:hypothetical protein
MKLVVLLLVKERNIKEMSSEEFHREEYRIVNAAASLIENEKHWPGLVVSIETVNNVKVTRQSHWKPWWFHMKQGPPRLSPSECVWVRSKSKEWERGESRLPFFCEHIDPRLSSWRNNPYPTTIVRLYDLNNEKKLEEKVHLGTTANVEGTERRRPVNHSPASSSSGSWD